MPGRRQAPRSNTEIVSFLPRYEVRPSEDFPSWSLVTCPREDCGETFLVKTASWFVTRTYQSMAGAAEKTVVITGRPCPYCFKAARLPARAR